MEAASLPGGAFRGRLHVIFLCRAAVRSWHGDGKKAQRADALDEAPARVPFLTTSVPFGGIHHPWV